MINLLEGFFTHLSPDASFQTSNHEVVQGFSDAPFKVALQKDGELTVLSSSIVNSAFSINIILKQIQDCSSRLRMIQDIPQSLKPFSHQCKEPTFLLSPLREVRKQ